MLRLAEEGSLGNRGDQRRGGDLVGVRMDTLQQHVARSQAIHLARGLTNLPLFRCEQIHQTVGDHRGLTHLHNSVVAWLIMEERTISRGDLEAVP